MKKKILLVEDDKSLQQLITYNFKKEGFKIDTISDGEEVVYQIRAVSYTHLRAHET